LEKDLNLKCLDIGGVFQYACLILMLQLAEHMHLDLALIRKEEN